MVDAAIVGDPQRVVRRSRPAVVVPTVEEYERLRHVEKAMASAFAALLLATPRRIGPARSRMGDPATGLPFRHAVSCAR